MSKKLAQVLGGDISFSSVLAEGSLFRLEIPLEQCEKFESLDQMTITPNVRSASRATSLIARVLVAEDNEINQEVTKTMLSLEFRLLFLLQVQLLRLVRIAWTQVPLHF